jgi:hypothetical protein
MPGDGCSYINGLSSNHRIDPIRSTTAGSTRDQQPDDPATDRQRIIAAGNANVPRSNPVYLGDTEIELPAPAVTNISVVIGGGVQFVTGAFGVGVTGTEPNVQVAIQRDWTRFQVADELNRMMELTIYDQQIVAVAPFRVNAFGPPTQVIFDGSTFTIENPLDAELPITFEFDSGYVLDVPPQGGDPTFPFNDNVVDNTTAPGVGTAEGFQISVNGNPPVRFEFDIEAPAAELVNASHVRIPYTTGFSQLAIAKAIVTAINGSGLGIVAKVLSGSRVQIDTTGNATVTFAAGLWNAAVGGGNVLLPTGFGKYSTVGLPGVAAPGGVPNRSFSATPTSA